MEEVPYVLVVGDEDVSSGTVGVNRRSIKQPERGVDLGEFIEATVKRSRSADRPDDPRASLGGLEKRVCSKSDGRDGDGLLDGDCVFCRIMRDGSAERGQRHRLARRDLVRVAECVPYTTGHLLVMPVRHISGLDELDLRGEYVFLGGGKDSGHGSTKGLRPRRGEHRCEPRQGSRRRDPRSSPYARASPLVRGHQLHDLSSGREGHARASLRDLVQIARGVGRDLTR